MRVAIKFAYDGTSFHGYQRQPDVRTVEGEIIRCLEKANIIGDVEESRFKSGSRTDKGVSALGNVIAFDTDFNADEIIPAHNANARDIWFHSIAEVDDDFNPRIALTRWYRYHLRQRENLDALRKATALFVGKHDFASFSRARGDTMKRIDSAEVRQEGDFTAIDIIGRSFLWQMVRKIVGAIERYESGEIDLGSIESALAGEWMVLGPAPPEPLFLMDVQYEIEIRTDSRICQKVSKRLAKKLERVTLKKELFERVAEKFAERTKSQTP